MRRNTLYQREKNIQYQSAVTMNNWRLLLLAVVVVVLPTGSFTKSDLIDGRENCEFSADVRPTRKSEERRSLNGNLNRRLANEERRSSSRNPERRYETRLDFMLTRSDRYLERSERYLSPDTAREQESQHRGTDLTREIRKGQNRDESRTLVQNERNFLQSGSRDTLDASRNIRTSRDDSRRFSNERESRNSMSRLPIRTSRSIEERMESPGSETTSQREREYLARSESRRLTKFGASSRFESRIQLDYRNKQSQAAENIRKQGAELKEAHFSERENRNSNDIQLPRQRIIDLSVRVSTNQRVSNRIAANRRHGSRDTARVDRMGVRSYEKDKRAHKAERRFTDTQQSSEELLIRLQQTRTSGIEMTRQGEHLERLQISMDRLSVFRQSRDRLSRDSERNSRNVRAARISVNREEHSEKRRLQSVNRISIDTIMPTIRRTVDITEKMREARQTDRRDVRDYTGERVQDNRVPRERSISSVSADRMESRRMASIRDQRETSVGRRQHLDNTGKTIYVVKVESRGNNEIDKFRRTASLSRFDLTRSITSSKQESRDITRASRSVESLRNLDDTRAFERDIRSHTRDQNRSFEKTHHNVATSQGDSRKSSRIDINRLERIVRSRDVRENEKRETRRDGDQIRMMSRRSNERVLRQENRDAVKLSKSVQEHTRLAGSGVSRFAIERVAERRQGARDIDARVVRVQSRDQREVRSEKTLEERAQGRVLTERRSQNIRETSPEIRNGETPRDIRGETRNRVEVRSERNLEEQRPETRGRVSNLNERKQESREPVREEAGRSQIRSSSERKINDRLDSRRQHDARQFWIERLAQRTSDRNGLRRESKNQRSLVIERTDQTLSRLIKDVKREESGYRNIDVAFYRNAMETDKSDAPVFSNWQMVLYTLQGMYACGLLMQMMTTSGNQTKKRTNYWSSPKNLIKVD